jgi:hypothetical protein
MLLLDGADVQIEAKRRDESISQQHQVEREGPQERRRPLTTDVRIRPIEPPLPTPKGLSLPVPQPKSIAGEYGPGRRALPILR